MSENSLTHYGIPGQKWGVRRYQYEDGSLTPEGRKRYGSNGEYDTTQPKLKEYRSEGYSGKTKMADYKNMSKEDLKEMVERMELENRYLKAVDARRGKPYVEQVAARASTIANLANSTNQILQFATGKNFSQNLTAIAERARERRATGEDDITSAISSGDLDSIWSEVSGSIDSEHRPTRSVRRALRRSRGES